MLVVPRLAHRVVVTGGSSGIGAAIEQELLDRKVSVWVVSRRPIEEWDTQPRSTSGLLYPIPGDLSNVPALARDLRGRLREYSHDQLGLVHCAVDYGADRRHDFAETTGMDFERMIHANLVGPLLLTKAIIGELTRARRGYIASLSSDVATQPGPGRAVYAATKGGTYAGFRALAAELSQTSVRVKQYRPLKQVLTPGIRRRRSGDIDPADYSSPVEIGVAIVKSLVDGVSIDTEAVEEL
jgi:short-subunit dehydrogenase